MARLRYTRDEVVSPAVAAREVRCGGVNIRLPDGGTSTITFYLESVDAAGTLVESRPHTIDLPTGLQASIDALVSHALNNLADAGYPSGGTVR